MFRAPILKSVGLLQTISETHASTLDSFTVRIPLKPPLQRGQTLTCFLDVFPVKNHTIPNEVIDRTLSASKRFFSLPLSQKEALDIHKSPNFKGYTALLGENSNPENRGDLHEGFDLGWEEVDQRQDGKVREGDGEMSGCNVWPDGLDGFRETTLEY